MLCDDLGDAVLRGASEILETVEHLRARIGADGNAASLCQLQRLAVQLLNSRRAACAASRRYVSSARSSLKRKSASSKMSVPRKASRV